MGYTIKFITGANVSIIIENDKPIADENTFTGKSPKSGEMGQKEEKMRKKDKFFVSI